MARQDFPKSDRVRTKSEIDRVFESGRRYSCKGMRLHALPNGRRTSRIVIVPVKSFSGAVARNRIKRLLREIWRLSKAGFGGEGQDCVVVVYPGADGYAERSDQLSRLLRQAGIFGTR